jgi:hypothetical protein
VILARIELLSAEKSMTVGLSEIRQKENAKQLLPVFEAARQFCTEFVRRFESTDEQLGVFRFSRQPHIRRKLVPVIAPDKIGFSCRGW